jgi:hypothetical protein
VQDTTKGWKGLEKAARDGYADRADDEGLVVYKEIGCGWQR